MAADSMDTPAVKKANEILAKYYPQTKPGYYPYLGMAGGIIIVEAMKRAGSDLTRAKLISSLEGLGHFEPGVLPPIDWSASYHGPEVFRLRSMEEWQGRRPARLVVDGSPRSRLRAATRLTSMYRARRVDQKHHVCARSAGGLDRYFANQSLFWPCNSLQAPVKFPVLICREFFCKPLIFGTESAVKSPKPCGNGEIPCIFPC